MKNLVIVILNYNDSEDTVKLIQKIKSFSTRPAVVIVDNASTDHSVSYLDAYQDEQVHLLVLERNEGYAKGNNAGIHYALEHFSAEYLAIANPDVLFEESVLSELIQVIENGGARVGLVAPRMCGGKSYSSLGAWKQPTVSNLIFNNFMLLKKIFGDPTFYKEHELSDPVCKVDVVSGSFFVCRAGLMKEIGYFDEHTFLYGEENILGMKLKNKGCQSYLCTKLQYQHEHSASIDKQIPAVKKKFGFLYDSMLYYIKTYQNAGKTAQFLYDISFRLGLFNYILLNKMRESVKRK